MKYTPEIVKKIVAMIEADNFTVVEICKNVDISIETFYNWIETKIEFSDAIKKAREKFTDKCIDLAEKSLIKKIQGYDWEEVKTVYISKRQTDGTDKPIIKEMIKTKKHVGPDTGSIIFFLCNKKPEKWKNSQHVENNVMIKKAGLDKKEEEEKYE